MLSFILGKKCGSCSKRSHKLVPTAHLKAAQSANTMLCEECHGRLEVEAKRSAEEAEAKRKAEEAEAKRRAEIEAKRKAQREALPIRDPERTTIGGKDWYFTKSADGSVRQMVLSLPASSAVATEFGLLVLGADWSPIVATNPWCIGPCRINGQNVLVLRTSSFADEVKAAGVTLAVSFCHMPSHAIFMLNARVESTDLTPAVRAKFGHLLPLAKPVAEWLSGLSQHDPELIPAVLESSPLRIVIARDSSSVTSTFMPNGQVRECAMPQAVAEFRATLDGESRGILEREWKELARYAASIPADRRDFQRAANAELTRILPTDRDPIPPPKPHLHFPQLRVVRGFTAQQEGPDGNPITTLGLSDAHQISDKVVFVAPAAECILRLMDGSRSVDEIVDEVGRGLRRPILEQLVAQLDDAGLLAGPTFDAIFATKRADFDASAVLPAPNTAQFAGALVKHNQSGSSSEETPDEVTLAKRMAEAFDAWIADALKSAADPALSALPRAVVVPHTDYPRCWINYAAVYGRLRVADPPDRVIILGTNHFGQATGVVACDKGYQTVFGTCHGDQDLIAAMRRRVGDKLFEHRYDHEHEYSIELQIPWIQHVFGKNDTGRFPAVFGVLVHDAAVNNGESYDGAGVGLQPFVDALRAAIAELPGRTLIICAADLSHVGPAFGDQQALAGDEEPAISARNKVSQHDQEMLRLVVNNKPWELVAAMARQQNPTRWCSIGSIVATLLTVQPAEVNVLNYSATTDDAGTSMKSSTAIIMS